MRKKKKKQPVVQQQKVFKHKYLEYDKCRISKSKARIKILLGKRSIGKTYGVTKHCLEEYFNDNNERIMAVRIVRKVEQVQSICSSLLGGPFQSYSDKYSIEQEKILRGLRNLYIVNNETGERLTDYPYCIVVALKCVDDVKQAYRDIDVDEIAFIMDEIITEDYSQYLDREVNKLLSVMSTIARNRPNTLYALGNAVSLMSPLLMYLDIDKEISSHPEIKYHEHRDENGKLIYAMEIFPDDAFEGQTEDPESSALASLGSRGNAYWQIIQSSKFNDSTSLCKNRDGESYRPICNLVLKDGTVLGLCSINNKYYVTDRENKDVIYYCEDARATGDEEKTSLLLSNMKRNELKRYFDSGVITFKNLRTKDQFLNLMRYNL